jgi:carbohydrate diacid regulator
MIQMKDTSDRAVGVIDANGTVLAGTDLKSIGESREAAAAELGLVTGLVRLDGYTYITLTGWSSQFEFAAFVEGEDSLAEVICRVASVALNGAKQFYEEKHDKATLIKNILTDNILPEDVLAHARDLHLEDERRRAVMLVHQVGSSEQATTDVVAGMFPDRQRDFVFNLNLQDVALVLETRPSETSESLVKTALSIVDTLNAELLTHAVVGIGATAGNLRELASSFKEAQAALEVGRVFDSEKTVLHYENLGIGRLIYQLPTTMCEMFLSEVFEKNAIEALDHETLFTIQKFFENNLNVSEASRKLFVHRNTLVYRLEKIKKLTGLDLREFDHAIIFKVALMVRSYLESKGAKH